MMLINYDYFCRRHSFPFFMASRMTGFNYFHKHFITFIVIIGF